MAENHPLAGLCETWLELIVDAKKQRWDRWGQYAAEMYKFYNGAHNFMWRTEYARAEGGFLDQSAAVPLPRFLMSIGKVSDGVDLFGPALIHQYPEVLVTPVRRPVCDPQLLGLDPQDPQAAVYAEQILGEQEQERRLTEAVASHKQFYLNWVQREAGKKKQARRAIVDAIVKGIGCFVTQLYSPRGSAISYPRSRYLSPNQLIKDPDARHPEELQWMAIEWTVPANLLERKFGLEPGALKGHMQSREAQASEQGRRDAKGNRKESYDLVTYYELFSKNGCGQRLKGLQDAKRLEPGLREWLEQVGDFGYLVLVKGIKYPLNLHPKLLAESDPEAVFQAAQWPIPFWRDEGSSNDWPVSELTFKEDPEDVWGISIFKPALGFIRFCNWCLSFLADKVAANACDYIGVMKAAADDIQEQLAQQQGPLRLIKIDSQFGQKISDLVTLIGKPGFDTAIWTMVQESFEQIDKTTGLSDLLYGQTARQMRSGTEAGILGENSQIRPSDMAQKADDWYAEAAAKEMQAAIWLLERQDLEPVLGRYGAEFWERHIATEDFDAVVRDYKYTLAAGSARKPNRAQKLRGLTDLGQFIIPALQAYAMGGQVEPWNNFASAMADALEVPGEGFLLQGPPAPAGGQGGAEAAAADQAESAAAAAKAELDQAAELQKLEARQKETEQKIASAQVQMELEAAKTKQKLAQDEEKHQAGLSQQYEKYRAEMVRAMLDLEATRRKMDAIKKREQGAP